MHASIAGPRIRAAKSYAGMNTADLAQAVGIGVDKLRGVMQQSNPRGEIGLEALREIADVTKVPRWFLEHGFQPPAHELRPPDQPLDELSVLRRSIDAIQARILGLETQLAEDQRSRDAVERAARERAERDDTRGRRSS